MASIFDSFPITPAMLAYAWVKPAVSFTTVAGKATMTDVYLPATLAEQAGAPGGVSAAVSTDPNYSFAIAAEGPAVECNATLSVTNVESLLMETAAAKEPPREAAKSKTPLRPGGYRDKDR